MIVLPKSVLHEIGLDDTNEVVIEKAIDRQIQNFLDAVPNSIDVGPPSVRKKHVGWKGDASLLFAYLKTCRYPDTEDANVNHSDDDGGTDN